MGGPASHPPPPQHPPSESSSTALLVHSIKGYLPVRLRFPSTHAVPGDDDVGTSIDDCTFFYVKEHQPPGSHHRNNGNQHCDTLFVANCPVHPTVSSKRLLLSVLGRYGDVRRVTIMDHPRRSAGDGTTKNNNNNNNNNNDMVGVDTEDEDAMAVLGSWTTRFIHPSFLPAHALPSPFQLDDNNNDDNQQQPSSTSRNNSSSDDGKFAHVVFRSSQDLKRTLRRLTQVMAGDPNNQLPAVTLDAVELQTLADAESSHDDDDDSPLKDDATPLTGVKAVAARYRTRCRQFMNTTTNSGRAQLLEECNRVVQAWEEQTEAEQRRLQAAAQEPDDDGFVTVTTTTTTTAVTTALEMAPHPRGGRRSAPSSSRRGGSRKKKKTMGGAQPLPDFYRFQTKETRKRSLHELRERFEQDLAKVQKRQQERQYAQPFG